MGRPTSRFKKFEDREKQKEKLEAVKVIFGKRKSNLSYEARMRKNERQRQKYHEKKKENAK